MKTEATTTAAETAPAVSETPAVTETLTSAGLDVADLNAEAEKLTAKVERLEITYLELFGYHCSNSPRGDLNKAERIALRRFAIKAGKDAKAIMTAAVTEWTDLASVVKRDTDEQYRITHPNLFTLVTHFEIVRHWAILRGHLPGVPIPQRTEHVRIGRATQATGYINQTRKG